MKSMFPSAISTRCLATKSSISFRDASPTLSNTARSPKMLRRRIRNQDIFDLIAAAGSLLCGLLVRTKWLDRSTVFVEFLIGFQRLLLSHCDASEKRCNDLPPLHPSLLLFSST